MSDIPNAPPFPAPYSAHTDIQLRELYSRVQGVERTVKIIEGEPVDVNFGSVKLMAIRPVTVAAVTVPYHRGWWSERQDPILVVSLKAYAVVLSITASVSERLHPPFWGLDDITKLGMSVSGWATGRDPTKVFKPNFATTRRFSAYYEQGQQSLANVIGFPVLFDLDELHLLRWPAVDPDTHLENAYRSVGRVLRTDVDLWVGMHHMDAQGSFPGELDWDPEQKGSIDVIVTYIESSKDPLDVVPTNALGGEILLKPDPSWTKDLSP